MTYPQSEQLWDCLQKNKKEVEKNGKYNCIKKTVFHTFG